MKTINDFIKELQNLRPELKELPVVIVAPNGLEFEPKIKILMGEYDTIMDIPKKMIITIND